MRRPRLALLIPAALAALALIAAGCGSDESDDEASEPLTKAEYITLGDQICAEADTEINATAEEQFGTTEAPAADEQEAFLSEVVAPSYQQQLDEISELTPPEEDQEEIDAILAALQELTDQAQDAPGELLKATEPPEASALAQAYGFTACGS